LLGRNHREYSLRPKDSGIYTEVVLEQSTVFLEEAQDLAHQWLPRGVKRHAKKIVKLLKIHKVIIAPLVIDGKVIGVFSVQGNDLREEDTQAITAFAILVAASWRKAELFEKAQQEIAARREADHQRLLQTKALEAAANGVLITDRQGEILWANPAVSKLTGYDLSEIIGKNTRIFNSKRQDKAVYRALWETIQAGGVWHGEMINRRKDGSLYSEDMTITPVYDAQDQINHYIAIKRDITERKRSERELVESEEKFATAFRSSPYPIILNRLKDERILEVNDGFVQATGYQRDEAVGLTLRELGFWIEPKNERQFLKDFISAKKSGQQLEFPFQMKNGEQRLFTISVEQIVIAGEDCLLTVAEDISDRKQAEEQLRLQAAALDAAANGIMITTPRGEIIWVNSAMSDLTGYSRQEILGQSPELFQSGEHDLDFYESIGATLDQKLVWQGEIINHRKDGSSYYEMQTIAPVLDKAGDVTHHIAIKYDVSDRKKAEREIQQRVIQLGAIISMGQVVTSSLDIDQILADVIAQVPMLVGAESQSVLLLEVDELVFVATSGKNSEKLMGIRMPASQGLAGQVLESGKSIFISHADQQDKIYRRVDEASGYDTKSIMAVPLIVDNQIIGVIEAVHSSLEAFDEDDLYLFETVAAWASIAIGNARHHEATQRRLQESEAFVNISRALSVTLETQETFRLIVDAAQDIIPRAEKTVIHLLDDTEKILLPEAVSGVNQNPKPELAMHLGEGVAGSVIEAGKAINVGDVQSDKRYISKNDEDVVQSLLVVPVQVAERILGTISVQSSGKNAFSQDDMRLLTILGLQAGLAIENARQHENIQRRFMESQTLAIISQALTETLELDELLQLIGQSVQQLIPISDCTVIHLLDDDRQALWPTVAIGQDDGGKPGFNIRVGEGIAGRVVKEGSTINIGNTLDDPRYLKLGNESRTNSLMVAPVQSDQRRYGTISVQSVEENAFSDDDERHLTILGFQAALAIKNARLFEAQRSAREQSDSRAVELKERERQLTIINDLAGTALEERDLESVLQAFALQLCLLLEADASYITLWDEVRKLPLQAAAHGRHKANFETIQFRSDEPSITEYVLNKNDALVIADLDDNPNGSARIHHVLGGKAMLALPLIVGEERLGAAMIVHDRIYNFGKDEILLGKHAANQVALAISKTRLLEETQRQFDELSILHMVSTAASGATDEDILIAEVTHVIGQAFRMNMFGILLIDESVNGLRCHPSYWGISQELKDLTVPYEGTIIGRVAAEGKPMRIPDVSQVENYMCALPETRSEICIPIKAAGTVIGVINAESVELNAFSQEDERLLTTIAAHLATSIEKIRLFGATQRQLSELSVLYDIAIAGAGCDEEDDLIKITTEIIGRIFDAHNYGVLLLDNDAATLYSHFSYVGVAAPVIVPIWDGIVGEVIRSQTLRRISDILTMDTFAPIGDASRSVLCVPLFAGDKIIGVVNLESRKINCYSESDERLLQTISRQLATTIENLRLFITERLRLKEVNTLYQISQEVVTSVDVNLILHQLTNLLKQEIGYYHVHVYLIDADSNKLLLQAGSGAVGEELKSQAHQLDSNAGIVGYVARSGEPFLANDVSSVPFFAENLLLTETVAEMAVPLIARDEIFGVLDIQHRAPHRFTNSDLLLATALADQIAVAMDKAKLYADLQASLEKEKSTRARLIQTEKLAAMGRLVASVAHELNNPLQAIQNALYLIQVEDSLSTQSQEDLLVALGETNRMSGLIARLRETYRPRGEADFIIASLNELVEEVHKLIATHLRHNSIEYSFVADPDLPDIPMIKDQIKQVILNLTINAIESMPDGGTLNLWTENLAEYSLARLVVEDSGPGIEPEILPNIFEPFFTTKSKGTGLGLAVSYEIIQVHGGKISVEPNCESGCMFEILIPLDRE
jgi:PAS domain S-box-containing protein